MSNENDDEYVLLEDDCSAKFLSKFPWILTWAYDFDKLTIAKVANKVKFKACGNSVAWKIGDRTSNLRRHIMDFHMDSQNLFYCKENMNFLHV